ncbi:MAG: hypothetical protein J6R24_03220 [Clostridia bacterium]|nr:hypothetical protein [Clostridia bacterium]
MSKDNGKFLKIIDLDGAFDKRMAEYFSKKRNQFTEEEWENFFAQSYITFSDTKIESLNATPNEYYQKMNHADLLDCVRLHFEKQVPIDGFLRRALEEERNRPILRALLDGDNQQAAFAVEIAGMDTAFYEEYVELLSREDGYNLHALLVDILKEDADSLCDGLLELYSQGISCEPIADIVSHCLVSREEVFFLLLDEFLKSDECLEQAVMRLVRYGDERALPYIKERAAREETDYLDFRALRLACEALGGSLPERDFSTSEEYLRFAQEEERQREERNQLEEKA